MPSIATDKPITTISIRIPSKTWGTHMSRLKSLIKYSPVLYNVYYYCFSAALKVIGLFVRTDEKLILFNAYGGRKYDDSPKAVFEKMAADHRFDDYVLMWALNDPSAFHLPERAVVVPVKSFSFFIKALRARVWITNSSMEMGLCFKKKKTIYINTWHGTAIKYLGDDVKKEGRSFKSNKASEEDIFLCQSEYDEMIFRRAFHKENLFRYGLPRNDELAADHPIEDIAALKRRIGIPSDKKTVLYAPTFREFTRNEHKEVIQEIPLSFHQWEKEMPDVVVLFRAHYEVAKHLDISQYPNVIDVSAYPDLNELMLVSDILLSDYSSIYFDFSILNRPMACYAYDYSLYEGNRGLYMDIAEELPCKVCIFEEDLLKELKNEFLSYDEYAEKTRTFRQKYVTEYGHAAQKVADELYRRL